MKTEQGIFDTVDAAINAEWDRKGHKKTDWLGMETILRAAVKGRMPIETLDEIIAAFTGRGNELP